MKSQFVQVGSHVVNLRHVAYARWESKTLVVHFIGVGRIEFIGDAAALLWHEIERRQDGKA